jgi:hypothetical protein
MERASPQLRRRLFVRRRNLAVLANYYASSATKKRAFFWIERACDNRDVAILQSKVGSVYDLLRDDPRYAPLLQRIGLEP